MFTVIISEKGGQQSRLDFGKNEITIGRMKGNDIVLPKGNVSKKHATISLKEATFFIHDHKSTNGTYVNGRKVTGEIQISESDKVYIGDFIMQLDKAAQPQPGALPTPAKPPQSMPFGEAEDDSIRPGFETLFDSGAQKEVSNDPLRSTYSNALADKALNTDSGYAMHSTQSAQEHSQPPPEMHNTPHSSAFGASSPKRPYQPMGANPATPPPTALPTNSAPLSSKPHNAQAMPSPAVLPTTPPFMSGVRPPSQIVQAPKVISEFDANFFRVQADVARILLEQHSIKDMPTSYPANNEDREKYRAFVHTAVAKAAPKIDKDLLTELILAECVGLGPIDTYLDSVETRDVYVNAYDQILVRRQAKLYRSKFVFSTPEFLQLAAKRLLGEDSDVLGSEELRFGDGTRAHIMMPPLAINGPLITIRKPPTKHPNLNDLVEQKILSPSMAEFLSRVVDAGRSVCIAGPTSSGKTTLISALAGLIPDGTRIISIEDYAHIELKQGSAVRLESSTNTGFDKRFLLRNALSMHPERIILDECCDAEAYPWITSAASGTDGSMLTVHGTSATDALNRLESLCLLGSSDISPRGLREQIARAVNIVIIVHRDQNTGFRVQQITEVQGVDLDSFRLNDIFYHRVEGNTGTFHPTGYIPLFYEDLRHTGIDADFNIFRE